MTKKQQQPIPPDWGGETVYSRGDSRGRPGGALPVGHSDSSIGRPRARRVVTSPQAASATAWDNYAQRRQQRYAARTKAPGHAMLTPRTLAQTGAPAVNGVVRPLKPLPRHAATPVPARSRAHTTRQRGFLWRLLAFLALIVILVFSVTFAFTSPAFRVAQVSVKGTHSDPLIQRIQQLGMLGQNIFLIDTASLTTRIDALPAVASASIEKQWPNQLTVTVTERVPVILWQTSNGVFSVDSQGVVIAAAEAPTSAAANHLLSVVDTRSCGSHAAQTGPHGCQGQPLHAGAQLNAVDIAFALTVFDQLPKLAGVTNFTLRYTNGQPADSANGAFVVASANSWIAYLGGANDTNPLNNRLLELQQILTLARQQQLHLATIDLRFGLRPVYTLKN